MTMKNMYSLQFDHLTCFIHVNNKEKRMMMNHVFFMYIILMMPSLLIQVDGAIFLCQASQVNRMIQPLLSMRCACFSIIGNCPDIM
jgi:hypothetical protein